MRARNEPDPPDEELDRLVEGFERFATGLVRLEGPSLDEVQAQVHRFARALEDHITGPVAASAPRPGCPPAEAACADRLRKEHQRFVASVEQLRGLLSAVETDDHGGHRQALGQYARVLVEALRAHLKDERPLRR